LEAAFSLQGIVVPLRGSRSIRDLALRVSGFGLSFEASLKL